MSERTPPANPAELTAALIDWLDSDDETYREIRVDEQRIPVSGAENGYYQQITSPYRCKNGPLHTLEELVNVKGFTPEVVQRITPYLAVNGNSLVNINTAGLEVLMALDNQLDRNTAQRLVDYRAKTPIDSIEQLSVLLPNELFSDLKSQANLDQRGTTSSVYRIEAQATFNDGHRRITAEVEKQTSRILFLKVD